MEADAIEQYLITRNNDNKQRFDYYKSYLKIGKSIKTNVYWQ